MKLRFETTLDDAIAFAVYHYDQSPTIKRQRLVFRWAMSLAVFAIVVLALRTTAGYVFGARAQRTDA